MTIFLVLAVAWLVVFSLLCGWLARQKGRSAVTWFMLGAVLAFVPTYGVRGYAYALAIATANHMLLNTVAAMVFVRKFAREEAPAA